MTKNVKAISVSLKEVHSGEKSIRVQDWQNTRAFVPKIAFFGHDKDNKYWIAEWWLLQSPLQYTLKRSRNFEVSAPEEAKKFDWADDAPTAAERVAEKPPFGIMPYTIVQTDRLAALQAAKERYIAAGKKHPPEWDIEILWIDLMLKCIEDSKTRFPEFYNNSKEQQ